ncbi:MAG: ATP synthase epsilon chain [Alphaproteobacteria bacterium]|jgi:F-type H+-transporting ATPase subunit epsilon|nr:MAG: ATP synthase epsilon chain [Alphaproteobacteria bacterium]|tara:strand:- start:199 stop:603 length:405 start_codon:yes stop_codon:yes gene_type:complete
MENKTKLEVITPTQTMINEEVEMVVVPGSEGHFGVLPLHAHTLSTLDRGIVTVYENNDASNEIIIDGGIADVTPQGCSILVERAEIVKSLDKNEIEKKYQFHKDKENSFENPIEEKANNDELKWLEFVLEQVKN